MRMRVSWIRDGPGRCTKSFFPGLIAAPRYPFAAFFLPLQSFVRSHGICASPNSWERPSDPGNNPSAGDKVKGDIHSASQILPSTLSTSAECCATAASFQEDGSCSGNKTLNAIKAFHGVSSASSGMSLGELLVQLRSPAEVEGAFKCSVQARTIGNAQLRRYLLQLPPKDHTLGLAAVKGSKESGLCVNAFTYEALLGLLVRGGQIKASMELYQDMLYRSLTPTPHSYAILMQLCLQRDMTQACQKLFKDMQKRGVRPSAENYELLLTSLAAETPSHWELAIEIFDKLSRERRTPRINAKTYNALMKVYLNMQNFDWRVVYNCYEEMRTRTPRLPLEWESYLILREALRKGKAGHVRRVLAYVDAWMVTTRMWSRDFLCGVLVYLAFTWVIKTILWYFFLWYYNCLDLTSKPAVGGPTLTSE